MFNKNKLSTILIFVFFYSCSFLGVKKNMIRIKGSDTMKRLVTVLANEYMKRNSEVYINVAGGGSAEGIETLIKGEVDICNSSRPMKAEEIERLSLFYNKMGLSFLIGKDAVVLYLNKNNPVKNLSLNDVKKIYECKIKKWSEIGGDSENIKIITRNRFSGTRLFFRERFLDGEQICSDDYVFPTTREIINFIENNKDAVGYGGYGFKGNINFAKINSVLPDSITIRNDKYPVTRYLHFYTIDEPKGDVKAFINWVISEEGQKIIEREGFISIWK
ncbi:phosphate-binding protein PstS precursor [bacterium BMS3Abin04]|nr:phosphate-binding protein PstS precursor [bacterium BMS3Abin04]